MSNEYNKHSDWMCPAHLAAATAIISSSNVCAPMRALQSEIGKFRAKTDLLKNDTSTQDTRRGIKKVCKELKKLSASISSQIVALEELSADMKGRLRNSHQLEVSLTIANQELLKAIQNGDREIVRKAGNSEMVYRDELLLMIADIFEEVTGKQFSFPSSRVSADPKDQKHNRSSLFLASIVGHFPDFFPVDDSLRKLLYNKRKIRARSKK